MFVERVIARLRIVVAVYLSFLFFPHRITFFFFLWRQARGKEESTLWAFFVAFFFYAVFVRIRVFLFVLVRSISCNRGGELAFEAPPLLGEQQLRTRFSIYRLKV